MPNWKKIESKFKRLNRNISYQETVALLEHYGYTEKSKGKTSGSRVRFTCENRSDILLHRPHPQKDLKEYMIRDLHNLFEQEGLWNE